MNQRLCHLIGWIRDAWQASSLSISVSFSLIPFQKNPSYFPLLYPQQIIFLSQEVVSPNNIILTADVAISSKSVKWNNTRRISSLCSHALSTSTFPLALSAFGRSPSLHAFTVNCYCFYLYTNRGRAESWESVSLAPSWPVPWLVGGVYGGLISWEELQKSPCDLMLVFLLFLVYCKCIVKSILLVKKEFVRNVHWLEDANVDILFWKTR